MFYNFSRNLITDPLLNAILKKNAQCYIHLDISNRIVYLWKYYKGKLSDDFHFTIRSHLMF